MWAILYYIFSYLVFFYTLLLMASYLYLVFMSRQAQ